MEPIKSILGFVATIILANLIVWMYKEVVPETFTGFTTVHYVMNICIGLYWGMSAVEDE